MTATIEERPHLGLRSVEEAELVVDREDIVFHDLPGDLVRIQVTVRNAGTGPSRPTPIRLESAPLGAFVPWQPLARLLVPALEPGESRELSTEAARPRPEAQGDFDRVPPQRLLTAISAPEQPSPQAGNAIEGLLNLFGRGRTARRAAGETNRKSTLARDLWDLAGRRQPYWAGNINVFVGSRPVERHLARALRIYPGRNNMAMFVVGTPGRPDGYAFELADPASDWNASLHDMSNQRSLVVNPSDVPIEEMEWLESNGCSMIVLSVQPPADCTAGKLDVHVTQRSNRKRAVVEFDLDPAAQGSGCYCV